MIYFILAAFIILFGAELLYLLNRFHRFFTNYDVNLKKKKTTWAIAAIPILIMIPFAYKIPIITIVVLNHLIVIWIIFDLIGLLVKKKAKISTKFYWQGAAALLFTLVYMSVAYYIAINVVATHYELSTTKDIGKNNLRVVALADSHIGATFDGEGFAKHMESIQKENPDLVVVVGDYVDDDTTKEDMVTATEALGKLKTTYGVYYVHGNHDKGYFSYRDFSDEDLVTELKKNNVNVLSDETVAINEDVCVVGRNDASFKDRLKAIDLAKDLDKSKYSIVLNHQPNDYKNEEAAGFDLVISGHTHGGQFFPIHKLSRLSGLADQVYGLERHGNTDFIVTSGISSWAIPFKTGTLAEYLVIDIKSN